jgi:hypothetical protein
MSVRRASCPMLLLKKTDLCGMTHRLDMGGCGLEISASTLYAFTLQFILYFFFNPCNIAHMSK